MKFLVNGKKFSYILKKKCDKLMMIMVFL